MLVVLPKDPLAGFDDANEDRTGVDGAEKATDVGATLLLAEVSQLGAKTKVEAEG